jgi:nitric oxide reductase large subunit
MLQILMGLVSVIAGLLINPFTLAAVFAVLKLRSTAAKDGPLTAAESRWRTVALVILVVEVTGLGLCGGFGTLAGLVSLAQGGAHTEAGAYGLMFLVVGIPGLALAGLGLWILRKYRREP